jgi:hypothetical protein
LVVRNFKINICSFQVASLKLSDKEAPWSEENTEIMKKYPKILTVFHSKFFTNVSPFSRKLLNFPWVATERPKPDKIFQIKTQHGLPITYLLTLFAYFSPFSNHLCELNAAAKEAPPSGENIANQKPNPNFL